MFGLFSRKKVEKWEGELLTLIFDQLPNCEKYKKQVENGLLKKVLINSDATSTTVNFFYDAKVVGEYENLKAPHYLVEGIQVFNQLSGTFWNCDVLIASGMVAGYKITGKGKFLPDLTKVDVKKANFKPLGIADFNKISHLFSSEELALINPSEVYSVKLKGKVYYHLVDLSDGDFIGIDSDKRIYKIHHDPFEIIEIQRRFTDAIKEHIK